jgi:iron complex outermembrane receptor protein
MLDSIFSNFFVKKQINRLLSVLVGTLVFSFSAESIAQGGILEEVRVTAQKREESIQDVGIAVTAFSGEQLKAFGFINNTEVAAFTPGVFISGNNGGHTQQFSIRGSTQNDFADIAEAPNAVYVDEAYQATGQSQLFASFDMERVEILKGPQGTLFGRNATGGLVHYVTNKPTKENEAYADLTYGSYDSVRAEGAVSGALSDTVSARIAGFYSGHDDVLDNTFTDADLPATPGVLQAFGRAPTLTSNPDNHDDLWTEDQWALRGQLLFEPNDDVSFLVKGHYAQSKPASGPYQEVSTTAFVEDTDGDGNIDNAVDTAFTADLGSNCEMIDNITGACVNSVFDADFDGVRPTTTGDFFGAEEADGTEGLDVQTDHTTSNTDRAKIWGVSGILNWDLDWANLVSVTSYSKQSKRQSLDVDSGPAPQFIVMNQSKFDWFSQELRLEGEADRYRWQAGLYYLNIDGKYAQGLADTIGGINIFGGLFFGPVFNGVDLFTGLPTADSFLEGTLNATLETDSYSFFGQVGYDLTDKLILNVGFRGIIEEKKYNYNMHLYNNVRDNRTDGALFGGGTPLAVIFDPTQTPVDFLAPHSENTSDFLWSAKLGLDYAYSDDLMLYASFNRGVKAGSFNAPLLTTLTADEYGYDEEVLLAYEIGFKSTLMDGRARLNVSAYYYDYNDYQGFKFIGTSGAVFNNDAKYKGIEAELQANPVDNVDLILGIGYIDAEVEDVEVAPGLLRDNEPSFTPEVQFSALGRYTWENVFGGAVSLQIDGNYASHAFSNINNFGAHRMDSYWIGNARVRWVSADEHWEVGGFVNNFSDTRNQNIGFELATVCGCDEQSFGKPRWAGINVRYNYF